MRLCECGCGTEVKSTNPRARYTAGHKEQSRTRAQYPCARCGGPKEKRRGSRYCLTCAPTAIAETKRRLYENKEARKRAARPPAEVLPDGYRRCARCKEVLPEAQFPARKAKPASYCTPCQAIVMHERNIARNYGLTLEDYDQMLEAQDGRCAICLTKPRTRRLAVDHDHATGEIRGLLCTRCNHKVLGAANENPAILRRAANYLENPPTRGATPAALGHFPQLQVETWMEELTEAIANDGAGIGVVLISDETKPVDEWYAIMPASMFAQLMKEAGR